MLKLAPDVLVQSSESSELRGNALILRGRCGGGGAYFCSLEFGASR